MESQNADMRKQIEELKKKKQRAIEVAEENERLKKELEELL